MQPDRWRYLLKHLQWDRPPLLADMDRLYVRPPRSSADQIVRKLKANPTGMQKFLLVGARGGGKSTELREVARRLGGHTAIASIDLDASGVSALAVSAFDLLYLSGLALLRLLPEEQREKLYKTLIAAYGGNKKESLARSAREALAGLMPFADAASRLAVATDLFTGAPIVSAGRESLARDVLDNPAITALARNPLMLTVLAIVHRAGVRLPDHRVELYSHASQILVERWNQVRSLASVGGAVPIKAADAARLLGPVALAVMRSEARGAVPEDLLRQHLARAIESGHLRALTSADEALELFQRSLGLLVEQTPGMYGFLHLTLAEYMAAWELVRTGGLEELAGDPREAFQPRWRETLLLAAAVLGILRAEDQRLAALVRLIVDGAGRRKGKPSPGVPSLLAGLLADDPDLSQGSAEALLDSLIPTWWFERKYGSDSIEAVFREAFELISRRLNRGRLKDAVRERLTRHLGAGLSPAMQENLARDPSPRLDWLTELRIVLVAADVDESGIFFQLCTGAATLPRWLPWPLIALHEGAGPEQPGEFLIGRRMARAARDGALRLDIRTNDTSIVCRPDWERQGDVDDKDGYVHVPFVLEDASMPVLAGHGRWVYIQEAALVGPLEAR